MTLTPHELQAFQRPGHEAPFGRFVRERRHAEEPAGRTVASAHTSHCFEGHPIVTVHTRGISARGPPRPARAPHALRGLCSGGDVLLAALRRPHRHPVVVSAQGVITRPDIFPTRIWLPVSAGTARPSATPGHTHRTNCAGESIERLLCSIGCNIRNCSLCSDDLDKPLCDFLICSLYDLPLPLRAAHPAQPCHFGPRPLKAYIPGGEA